jgi:hypothetical protein
MQLIHRYATRGKVEVVYDPRRKHGPLVLKRSLDYFGFELESELETVDVFPDDLAKEARHALAEAMARGDARHFAVKQNRDVIEEIREAYKRSGGTTKRLGLPDLIGCTSSSRGLVDGHSELRAGHRQRSIHSARCTRATRALPDRSIGIGRRDRLRRGGA